MEFVNKIFFLILLLCVSTTSFSQQKNSEKLKAQQRKLEKDIQQTKILLKQTSNNKQATLNSLSLLEDQLKSRERLMLNYDQQIRYAELTMDEKSKMVKDLQTQIEKLKEQYKQLLIYVYKHQLNTNKAMYLLSAHSFYESFKRNEYLKQISDLLEKQKALIVQHQFKLNSEIQQIAAEKANKEKLLNQKKSERDALEQDHAKVQSVANQLSQQEGTLLAKVKKEEQKKANLQRQIQREIQREVAAEMRRREAAAKALAAKREAARKLAAEKAAKEKAAKEHSTVASNNPTVSEENEETPTFESHKELELNQSFETNKGRLPFPVASGRITSSFGRHTNPLFKDVVTNNNGVDITTSKDAQVRAVFNGTVTSVLSMAGVGKVVIIKHGNYRSVYTNLRETYVASGATVKTKQAIGSLLPVEGENISILHFELYKTSGSSLEKQNPSLWLAH